MARLVWQAAGRRWSRAAGYVDVAVAAALVGAVLLAHGDSETPVGVTAGALAVGSVAVRGRWPLASCAVLMLGLSAMHGTVAVAPIAIALDYFALGRRTGVRGVTVLVVVLLVAPLGIIAAQPGISGFVDVVTPWLFFGAVPFGAGWFLGRREVLTRRLDAQVEQLEREQREHERRLAAVERGRIARDLHDVVGHHVSVMVIQAVAARRVAALDPEAAREALGRVAATGRAALAEIGALTGRAGDDREADRSVSGIEHLNVLVERASAAGLPVVVTIGGTPRRVPPGIDLAAFRVVQEALTNVLKHAGRATATVSVAYEDDSIAIEVTDTGRGSSFGGDLDGGGRNGIIGMRERVSLYGGDLRSGARPGGGFVVAARIPLPGGAAL